MLQLLVRRLGLLAILLAAVACGSFALGASAPGSFDQAFRLDSHYSAGAMSALRARHDLDRPVLERLGRWAAGIGRGSLGTSVEYDAPVAPLVVARAGRTLLLGVAASALAWPMALLLGVSMAARPGSLWDRSCRLIVDTCLAVPPPVFALVLTLVALETGIAAVGGMRSPRADNLSSLGELADLARHLALPVSVLALDLVPALVRHVRNGVRAALDAPFILASRARGVPPSRLLFRSALRVAAAPLLSLAGLSIAGWLSASLVVEVLTGWPGLGPLLVEATKARDVPVVAAVTTCSAVFLALGGLVSDVALHWADPRISTRAQAPVEP